MVDEPEQHGGGEPIALDAAVDQAVAACDGDPRAAIAALLVLLEANEEQLEALRIDVERIEATVSGGFVRRKPKRHDGHGDAQ